MRSSLTFTDPGLYLILQLCLAIALLANTAAALAAQPGSQGGEHRISRSPREKIALQGGESASGAGESASIRKDAMVREAERAYRSGDFGRALQLYRRVAGDQPDDAFAWLRIGNLQQRRAAWLQAAVAYRKAASLSARATPSPGQLRAKALLNLASVNLQLAELALAEFDTVAAMPESSWVPQPEISRADGQALAAPAGLAPRLQAKQVLAQLKSMVARRSSAQVDQPDATAEVASTRNASPPDASAPDLSESMFNPEGASAIVVGGE